MTIPNVPRFNVPETFGQALSYEGQIHAILGWYDENADAVNSAVDGIESAITDANAATANANTATANANAAAANAETATANAETATVNADAATTAANTATAAANTATANANSAAAAARTAAASYTDEPMTTTRLMYPGTSTPGDYLKAESDGEPITSDGCTILPLYGPSGTIGDDYIGLHFILTGNPSSSDGATLVVPLSEYVGFGLHDQLPNSMRMRLEKTSDISVAPPANADVDALPSFRLRSTSPTGYLFDLTAGTDEAVFDIEHDYGDLSVVFKCNYGTVYYTVFRIVLEFDPPIKSNYDLAVQASGLQDYTDQMHLNNYEYGVSFRNDWIVHPSGSYTSNGLTARYAPTDEENKGRPVIWVTGTMTDTSTDTVFDFIPENVTLLGGTRYGILNHTYSSDLYVKVIGRYTDGLVTTDDELTGWVGPENVVWFEVPDQDYTEFGFSIMRSATSGEISEYTSPLIEIVKSNIELEEMINDVQADGAVTTPKIADGAVTTPKLANAVRTGYVRSFETVADMQAATDLLDGMTCHTDGFHASGDGGAAYYAIGTTGTANGMDVLALQDGLIATLVITDSCVTPEMFGAYGDGIHDDTIAIQASIDTNLIVNFLANTYLINVGESWVTGGIFPKSNQIINLEGATLQASVNTNGKYSILNINNVENVIINGGIIIGDVDNREDSGSHMGYGISISQSLNVVVNNVQVSKCRGDAIIIHSNDDISNPSENIQINGCILHDCVRQGISIVAGIDVSIRDCEIYGIGNSSPSAGIDIESERAASSALDANVDRVAIENCYIHDTYGQNIIVSQKKNNNIRISSCIFDTTILIAGSNCTIVEQCIGNGISTRICKNLIVDSCKIRSLSISGANCIVSNSIIEATDTSTRIIYINNDSSQTSDYLKFVNCAFKESINTDSPSSCNLINSANVNISKVIFDGCSFNFSRSKFGNTSPSSEMFVFHNCTFNLTYNSILSAVFTITNTVNDGWLFIVDSCTIMCNQEITDFLYTTLAATKTAIIRFTNNVVNNFNKLIHTSNSPTIQLIVTNNVMNALNYSGASNFIKLDTGNIINGIVQ